MGAGGGRNWNGRNWNGRNWNGRNWSGRNWHGHRGHNNVIFIGGSAFPAGGAGVGAGILTGATPITDTDMAIRTGYYGYGYGYPGYGYGNYGYGSGNDYGNGYANSSPTKSKVAELQRRLSRAGYYRGSVDGILGPQTRRAIRAYESDHGYADAG